MDTIAIAQVNSNNAPPRYSTLPGQDWDRTYRPLPHLFFGLAVLWMLLVIVWTANTWSMRRWQTSNLQWVLTVIPAMKTLVMGLSFVFWYSCLHLKTCSFWVAFGVFVSRIFFETACFVTFLLISYGYCIMHEQLSLTERRSVAGLTSLLYLTLTGYKAAVPQFAVLIIFIYAVLLYVIMAHITRNLSLLREQLQQIQAEGVHMMQNAVHTKYTMFRKFQGAVLTMVVAEILVRGVLLICLKVGYPEQASILMCTLYTTIMLIMLGACILGGGLFTITILKMHAQTESIVNEYWVRLLVREITEVTIFFFIGWTFRSREQTPFFNVMPTSNTSGQRILAPIYSVEMDERQFRKLDYKEWHIGVPTPISRTGDRNRPMLVIVQNPGVSDLDNDPIPNSLFKMSANFQHSWPDPSSSHDEGLQLRLRANGELSSTITNSEENKKLSEYCHWDTKCHKEDNTVAAAAAAAAAGYLEEVAVDVKGLKNYSFLPFENPCCDIARPLHSRSNSSKSLQASVHYQSYSK